MFMGFGLLLTIGVVAAVAYALGWRPQDRDGPFFSDQSHKSPMDIAKERYALGEINKQEYFQIRQDLGN